MNEEYLDRVSEYLRNQNDEGLKKILFAPENIHLTYDCLTHLKRDVERQFAYQHSNNIQKKMEFVKDKQGGFARWQEHQVHYAEWKAKAIRFLTAIEECIVVARAVKRDLHDNTEQRIEQILDRIRDHRDTIQEEEGSEADQELWAVLNG